MTLPPARHAVLTAIVLLMPACGGEPDAPTGPGPETDVGKSAEDLQVEVKTVETPVLEQAATAYKEFIASKEGELALLESKIKEQAGGAIDALMGEGSKTEEMKAELEKLEASVEALRTDLEELHAKLEIYLKELSARA